MHEAKARLSELLETSLSEGPPIETRHGKAAAVLVLIRQWEALQAAGKRTLQQVLLDTDRIAEPALPLRGGLKLRRI